MPRYQQEESISSSSETSAADFESISKEGAEVPHIGRILLGLGASLVAPQRMLKVAVAVRPATLLRFHRALVRRKYQWLFSANTRRRPGPKGPSKELIAAILEIKRLNPRFGCPRIAQQISHAFGLEIDKDVVRRILANHPLPESGGSGPSWLSAIAEARDSLWSVDLFRCESILLKKLLGDGRDGCPYASYRRIRCRTCAYRRHQCMPHAQPSPLRSATSESPQFRS